MSDRSLTVNDAKCAIYALADDYSWETMVLERVLFKMVARMSGDEARDFLSDFQRLYGDS